TGRRSGEGGARGRANGCREFEFMRSLYADDGAFLLETRSATREAAILLREGFRKFGLEMHVGTADKSSKTEVVYIPATVADYATANLAPIALGGGAVITTCDEFRYLGSMISYRVDDSVDVDARVKAAAKAFGALSKPIFRSPRVDKDAKGRVYESLVVSILLFGCETWSLTKRSMLRLRTFHRRCCRTMCMVSRRTVWKHRLTAGHLEGELGIRSLESYLASRALRWLGHVRRMPMTRLPRLFLASWVNSSRHVGRPRMPYGQTVKDRYFKRCLKHPGLSRLHQAHPHLVDALRRSNPTGWFEVAEHRGAWDLVCRMAVHEEHVRWEVEAEKPLRQSARPATAAKRRPPKKVTNSERLAALRGPIPRWAPIRGPDTGLRVLGHEDAPTWEADARWDPNGRWTREGDMAIAIGEPGWRPAGGGAGGGVDGGAGGGGGGGGGGRKRTRR
ncbi:MAG: hypothetical protein ACPGQ5_13845, partial [Alphaproteobacteria bacterium]